ncbi:Apoptogenic protein 1, mitochondrial, partial [Blomia tropicalis]
SNYNKNNVKGKTQDQISVIPHPLSKLRLEKPGRKVNETKRERLLRKQRIELQAWNHHYWSTNNSEFNRLKKEFVQKELSGKCESNELLQGNQSHEELALFYKQFLDANRRKHISYNFEWYKWNFKVLLLTLMVQVERIFLGRISKN